ncbi:MAG: CHAT domain-containing protein [Gammaproteobacteria bacterium]|nr:CHAT domain-containing protein [Gammaproteobacteria bacterium]
MVRQQAQWIMFVAVCWGWPSQADVVLDGSLGSGLPLGGDASNFIIDEIHGELAGENLFHSFLEFNLTGEQQASFTATSPVRNVVSRVTGGPSTIAGQISSDIPGANLFFINPQGITFTESAQLDVQGSFHASTADYLSFGEDQHFYASTGMGSVLSPVDVTAFGFLGQPAPIEVIGATLRQREFVPPPPRNLGLIGGDITISGATLDAPQANLNLVSVNSPGEVSLNPNAGFITSEISTNATGGSITITNGSLLDVGGSRSGLINIHAGSLVFESSRIRDFIFDDNDGGGISINAATVMIRDGARLETEMLFGEGRGGDIDIQTGTLTLEGESFIRTLTAAPGAGGNITIDADQINVSSGSGINTETEAAGPAGNIVINTSEGVDISGRGLRFGNSRIQSLSVFSQGDTGSISVNVSDGNLLLDEGFILTQSLFSTGNAGDITLQANNISIVNAGGVASSADSIFSSDAGGSTGVVSISAAETVLLENSVILSATSGVGTGAAGLIDISAADLIVAGGDIAAVSRSLGNAGDIDITVDRLEVLQGGSISNATSIAGFADDGSLISSPGSGGAIRIQAGQSVLVDGKSVELLFGFFTLVTRSTIDNSNTNGQDDPARERVIEINTPELTVSDGARIDTDSAGSGNAGNIRIDVATLNLIDGGIISSSPVGTGNGGNIEITASASINISGAEDPVAGAEDSTGFDSRIRSTNIGNGNSGSIKIITGALSLDGGFIEVDTASPAGSSAGEIDITAEELVVLNGGQISSNTSFPEGSNGEDFTGNAGRISILAGRILLDGAGSDSFTGQAIRSGVFAGSLTAGDGGNIAVSGNELVIESGATISLEATASGAAGNLLLEVRDIRLADSNIETLAASGNGGNIKVGGGSVLFLDGSSITSSVGSGEGDGGNIQIDPDITALAASAIRADAFGGDGGNIDLNSSFLILDPGSEITASSQFGREGTIDVASPESSIIEDLVDLPATFLAASDMFSERCAARQPDQQGSLVVASRAGLPVSPDSVLLAFDYGPENSDLRENAEDISPRYVAMRGATHQGLNAFKRGDFEKALADFNRGSRSASTSLEAASALHGMAQSQQALGAFDDSVNNLLQALKLSTERGDKSGMVRALGSLGNAYLALEEPEKAEDHLRRAADLARMDQNRGLAVVLNNLGNHYASVDKVNLSLTTYRESVEVSQRAGEYLTAAQALANAARLTYHNAQYEQTNELLQNAVNDLQFLKRDQAKSSLMIHLGRSQLLLANQTLTDDSNLVRGAFESLTGALEIAFEHQDITALTYAYGNLGALYQQEGHFKEALELTHRAILHAGLSSNPSLVFQWHWQVGQLLWLLGGFDESLTALARAVDVLVTTRQETTFRYDGSGATFRDRVEFVYLDLVDALIKRSQHADQTIDSRQQLLHRARSVVEKLKAAELRDYFRDECVAELEGKAIDLDMLSEDTAIIYPVVLEDRVEILLTIKQKIFNFSSPVSRQLLLSEVEELRYLLLDPGSDDYLDSSQQLYEWLIQPYRGALEKSGASTLVFVLDGPLLNIPMAVLHDGENFLVEKFAVALTPGLELTDPQPLDPDGASVLLAGLSEGVQGFNPLKYVPTEINAIRELWGGEVMLDKHFTADNFQESLLRNPYSIVHIASHGTFTGDFDQSFLLTHDGRISLSRLSEIIKSTRYRDDPLELLVLSACETAVGDSRAALGLAGIAIKSGARSAIGSLWQIDDRATASLVESFYRELRIPGTSKANALQKAQKGLIDDADFGHPSYWAAFMLVSNWL